MPRRTHSPSTRPDERRPLSRKLQLDLDLARALRLPDPRDVIYELRRDGEPERAYALQRALRLAA